jgi:hypothetical protein
MARIASKISLAVLLAGLLVGSGGCANTNNRDEDTRGASLLILDSLEGDNGTFILSDVCLGTAPFCAVINDNASGSFRNEILNPDVPPTGGSAYWQDITLYRYHVTYTRSDGNNVEGVDVPYGFDSVMNFTIPGGGSDSVGFIIVRHAAKEERPLVDLAGLGDEEILSTNTRVDFWGRDIAGNEHQVFGWIDIEFADFPG